MVLAILVKPCSAVLKSNRFFFLICLRVCGEPRKTAGPTHSKDLLKIIDVGEQPDYEQCISIPNKASLNEMLTPRALVQKSLGDLQFLAHRWQCTA